MLLDLSIPVDQHKAETYLSKLINDGSPIELRKINKKRTIKQNAYVHALFTLYGGEFGWTTDEAKTVIKRELGYTYERNGGLFLQHTSEMDTKQLTTFIDRFRNLSASQGMYLPSAEEFNENYVAMMKEIARIESLQNQYGY